LFTLVDLEPAGKDMLEAAQIMEQLHHSEPVVVVVEQEELAEAQQPETQTLLGLAGLELVVQLLGQQLDVLVAGEDGLAELVQPPHQEVAQEQAATPGLADLEL
jgi:hypothetical protein